MKIPFAWLLLLLTGGTPLGARSDAPIIECAYGDPVRYAEGILQCPDFTVRLRTISEYVQADSRTPWVAYVFEVLDREGKTIGGDITFNSEERANGRRFDVRGKIYVAEMFSTTAGLPSSSHLSCHTRLADGQIVIWDQATAANKNKRLVRIWQTEKVDPSTRYSSVNAYADGVLIPGFSPPPGRIDDGRSRLVADSLVTERVALIGDERLIRSAGAIKCAYGSRANFQGVLLGYLDFSVRLAERDLSNPFDGRAASVVYRFQVFDRSGNRTKYAFDFTTDSLAEGCMFEVEGEYFFAEMFATTASLSGPEGLSRRPCIPLREGEIILWDEETARSRNPSILPAWAYMKTHTERPGAKAFAGGVPLLGWFTGTYFWSGDEWCEYTRLDAPPAVLHRVNMVYPPALSGSGFVAHMHGMIFVKQDGSVDHAITTWGNEELFQAPSQVALAKWQFSPPSKNGKPTKAVASFDWVISEPLPEVPDIRFR